MQKQESHRFSGGSVKIEPTTTKLGWIGNRRNGTVDVSTSDGPRIWDDRL